MDSYVLTGPNGSSINIGTYIRAADGPDFGSRDLLRALYAENAVSDGGVLKIEDVGVRHFTFPMVLASNGAFTGGLTGLETMIRNLARPGGYVDLFVDGVATADAIRFDVLAGRLEEDYSIRLQQADRRLTTLKLDVQPIGYLPTLITLASAASIGLPGSLVIPNGSIMGDWPGQAELTIVPTNGPTTYGPASWYPDMLAWSMAGRASHVAFWPAASIFTHLGGTIASVIGDFAAPASQALAFNLSAALVGAGQWGNYCRIDFVTGSGPVLEGRQRLFAWANLTPSQAGIDQLSADLVYETAAAMGSAQPIATLPPAVASGAPGAWGAQPSSGYQLLDLGEVQPEPAASFYPGAVQSLRFWFQVPSYMVATQTIKIGGIYMLPQDGPAGVLPLGLSRPTVSAVASVAAFDIDARPPARTMGLVGPLPVVDYGAQYRGGLPYVGASSLRLDLLAAHRKVESGATNPMVYGSRAFAAASVRYRPRFMFLKGI